MPRWNFELTQDTDVTKTLTFLQPDRVTPVDLTGATARFDIRRTPDTDPPFLSLATATGSITITGPSGVIALQFTAALLAPSLIPAGTWPYDLLLIDASGHRQRTPSGSVTVRPRVTR